MEKVAEQLNDLIEARESINVSLNYFYKSFYENKTSENFDEDLEKYHIEKINALEEDDKFYEEKIRTLEKVLTTKLN